MRERCGMLFGVWVSSLAGWLAGTAWGLFDLEKERPPGRGVCLRSECLSLCACQWFEMFFELWVCLCGIGGGHGALGSDL